MTTPIILGLSGLEVSLEEEISFGPIRPYGFILFKRNIKSQEQVRNLCSSLREKFGQDIYIFIDEEGGRVSRLTSSSIVPKGTFPEAYSFYEIYKKDGLSNAVNLVEENYFKIGQVLADLGINANFAPVADLFYEEAHQVIGSRSFGREPEIVVALCKAALRGLKKAGIEGCIKHIPGHGLAMEDSHLHLPVVKKDLAHLEANDFKVFKELANSSKFAMTAHVLYQCLDEQNPVTTSQDAIKYIRDTIGFGGTLITDCITMKALGGDLEQIAKDSLDAGCDVVLYAQTDLQILNNIIGKIV